MNLGALTSKAWLAQRGKLRTLDHLEQITYPQRDPYPLFPRTGTVSLSGSPAIQHTGQTCGTTVLALANALFDPRLRNWLLAEGPDATESEHVKPRFLLAQQHLLGAVTRPCWPRALGTPPWGLARELRIPGVRYLHLPVDDADPALTETLTSVFSQALAAGIPIPLYVGGSAKQRLSAAVPRHVVMLVPPGAVSSRRTLSNSPDHVRIFEPARGRVYRRRWERFWNRERPETAFGGWVNVMWALVPTV